MSWNVGVGFEGRTVILTGATGGIGQAVTRAFATTGARIHATDLDQGRLDTLMSDLPDGGHRSIVLDLRDEASQQALIDFAVGEMDGLHVLVHTAALLRRRSNFDEVTEDD